MCFDLVWMAVAYISGRSSFRPISAVEVVWEYGYLTITAYVDTGKMLLGGCTRSVTYDYLCASTMWQDEGPQKCQSGTDATPGIDGSPVKSS